MRAVFRPSGFFNPTPNYTLYWLANPMLGDQDPFETGGAPFGLTTAWRSYFYATRNGVHGLDVRKH